MANVVRAIQKTQKPTLNPISLPAGQAVQYPSAYFTENPGKPVVRLPTTNTTQKAIEDTYMTCLSMSDPYPVKVILAYMGTALLGITEKLNEPWVSFGAEIGDKDSVISSLSVFNVDGTARVTCQASAVADRKANPKIALMTIVCAYRLGVNRADQ